MLSISDEELCKLAANCDENVLGNMIEMLAMPKGIEEDYLNFDPQSGWDHSDISAVAQDCYDGANMSSYRSPDGSIVLTVVDTKNNPIHIRGEGWAIMTPKRFEGYKTDAMPAPAEFKDRESKDCNTITSIGFLGGYSCYLNVPQDLAIDRYLEQNKEYTRDDIDESLTVETIKFVDEFGSYEIRQKEK